MFLRVALVRSDAPSALTPLYLRYLGLADSSGPRPDYKYFTPESLRGKRYAALLGRSPERLAHIIGDLFHNLWLLQGGCVDQPVQMFFE